MNKTWLFGKLAVALFALTALAATPSLKVPEEVKGEAAEFLRVPAETECKQVRWVPIDRGLAVFPPDLLKDSKTAVVIAKGPGRYRLLAYTCAGDEPSAPVVCVVVVGESPPPPPGPSPTPVPPPQPLAKAWLVVVEETADAAASRGAYLADRELAAWLAARGWKHRVADKDARDAAGRVPADLAPYLGRAAGKKLPQVYVVGADGTPHYEGDLPPTPAALLEALKKLGGRER